MAAVFVIRMIPMVGVRRPHQSLNVPPVFPNRRRGTARETYQCSGRCAPDTQMNSTQCPYEWLNEAWVATGPKALEVGNLSLDQDLPLWIAQLSQRFGYSTPDIAILVAQYLDKRLHCARVAQLA
jgi:hypothetical protein